MLIAVIQFSMIINQFLSFSIDLLLAQQAFEEINIKKFSNDDLTIICNVYKESHKISYYEADLLRVKIRPEIHWSYSNLVTCLVIHHFLILLNITRWLDDVACFLITFSLAFNILRDWSLLDDDDADLPSFSCYPFSLCLKFLKKKFIIF